MRLESFADTQRATNKFAPNTQQTIKPSSAQEKSVRPAEHGPALGVHAARRALRLAGDNGVPSSLIKRNRKGLGTGRRSPLVSLLGAARTPH